MLYSVEKFKMAESSCTRQNYAYTQAVEKTMIQQLENFPELAKAVRKQLVLSQEELAHALDVSFATVNRWENCKTAPSKLARR